MARGDGFALRLAEDFGGAVFLQLSDLEAGERGADRFPVHSVREYQREIAAHWLIARKLVRGGLAQRLAEEAIEIDFSDKDRLSQLALGSFVRVQLTEVADGRAVDHAARSARGVQPAGQQAALRRECVVIDRARSESASDAFNEAF
jgi:hypothetical protein